VNHRESHGEPGSGHHLRPTLGGLQPQLRGAGERGPLDCRGRQFRDKSWECSDSLGSKTKWDKNIKLGLYWSRNMNIWT
jgi:hypothetical protein